ncbi:MAG TPA: efflux transporter outer membrane subunit [Candidatus Dormibacteraeota bacterium]|nr:efflux transporter outer membrane subunit [Candidatus Dormibacteraeota bacterium]
MARHVRNNPLSLFTALILLVPAALATGCAVGPNYKRPNASVPAAYRGLSDELATSTSPASLGDQKWWEVFQDKELQGLIRKAVQDNYNVRIAAARILEARAQLGITRADQFPSLNAGGNITSQRSVKTGSFPGFQQTSGQLNLSASWNLDFWGRYRRATEAQRATLLSQEWARQAVISSLVASVASSYFQLRELDLELDISKRTLASRSESLKLTTIRTEHGIDTMLDQRQSEQLVYTAAAQVPDFERQIEQQENTLSVLLGNNPGAIPRGLGLTEQPHAPEVPAGLPSALLERRPDIHEAEQNLIAANAQIGAARAAYFPQISLTGTGGYQSTALTNLFTGPAGLWNFGGSLVQPIFQGGRLKNNVRLAEARREQMLLTYQQTIQGAFRDVSNSLIAYRKNREFRIQREKLTAAAQEAAQLSEQRFNAGATDYLEVLTNETNYFSDELTLAQAQFNELQAMVQLYQALGGGWQR